MVGRDVIESRSGGPYVYLPHPSYEFDRGLKHTVFVSADLQLALNPSENQNEGEMAKLRDIIWWWLTQQTSTNKQERNM